MTIFEDYKAAESSTLSISVPPLIVTEVKLAFVALSRSKVFAALSEFAVAINVVALLILEAAEAFAVLILVVESLSVYVRVPDVIPAITSSSAIVKLSLIETATSESSVVIVFKSELAELPSKRFDFESEIPPACRQKINFLKVYLCFLKFVL